PRLSPALAHVLPLLLILVVAGLLRIVNLHYSEFQGDEALAMISAAEALEGHEDALFLRAKGPGEVLLPMALWRLTGTINEPLARLPFTLAALLAVLAVYRLGIELGGRRTGWLAAGFFAINGFMVAFGRIVQYQALVVWLSALAVLMLLHWRQTRQMRFAVLGGLALGAGLLAHYDAVLALPALGWLLISTADRRPPTAEVYSSQPPAVRHHWSTRLLAASVFAIALLLVALPFYLPFSLDPQANHTGAYVGQRIGAALRNNLPDFFHFNTFYSSAYYIILTGLLVLGGLGWPLWRSGRLGRGAVLLLAPAILAVMIWPERLAGLSILPFAGLFLGAFLAVPDDRQQAAHQALIVWLAVPFLGYNFVVALGLTHIYTTVPAWALLAALGWEQVRRQWPIQSRRPPEGNSLFTLHSSPLTLHSSLFTLHSSPLTLHSSLFALCLALSTIFLWNAFLRHDVEYWQDYPDGNLGLFWNPYPELPQAGFFGFAHRAGWKAIGQKIAVGELKGDYGSNEEPDVTTWYSRGAPRACDPEPEFYFLAADLIDPVEVPWASIQASYAQIGVVALPNQKQMQLMQRRPTNLALGALNDRSLAREFDRTATPAAFARSVRGAIPVEANFGGLIRLIGYDLDPHRAYAGGRLPVTLYWQALAGLPASYQVFTHLESEAGPVAQADGVPVCWTYPTDRWRPGQIIADQHAIAIPLDAPPGRYPLTVGLYLPGTFERLDVLDIAGNPAGVSVTLAEVEVGD
ncbi:MAG: glycosyltransferase family 39 protein, partial [Chloroflexota bacterium]